VTEAKNRLSALLAKLRAREAAPLQGDADGRLARLQRAGVLHAARSEPPIEPVLQEPPRLEGGASAVQALIDERRADR
jgi:hypothetical protein